MICPTCGTDKRSGRQCCVEELARLRAKNNRLHDVLDEVQDERDRLASRLAKLEGRRVVRLVDPWEETA